MGPMRVRHLLTRLRRPATIAFLVLAFASAITLHHSNSQKGDHGGMTMSAAVEYCLGAFAAVGAAVVAVALGSFLLRRVRAFALVPVAVVLATRPPVPRARAGPAYLRLCVLLR